MPGPPRLEVQVASPPHVRAFFHVLAHFDLGRSPLSTWNPAYVRAIGAHRPPSAPSPSRDLGRYHTLLRAADGRHCLGVLGAAFEDEREYVATVRSLEAAQGAPPQIPPLLRRALAPLAEPGGGPLVGLCHRLATAERAAFLDGLYRGTTAPGAGIESFLVDRLRDLLPVLYGDTPQRLLVFPIEALATRSFHVSPARGAHHVALPASAVDAFFHVLYALVRHRTDRLIRPFVPAAVRSRPGHPMQEQMRIDCAMTTTLHLLLRKRPDDDDRFRAWARQQFALGERQPDAAVAALHPMSLLPDEAIPAVKTLLGDEVRT